MPTLTWQRAEGKPQTFRVKSAEISIGRDAANSVRLDSTFVSRQHAVIRGAGRAFTITDLGSANGTFVNGVRVETAPLADGDAIKLGSESLVFTSAAGTSWQRLAIIGLGGVAVVLVTAVLLLPSPESSSPGVGGESSMEPSVDQPAMVVPGSGVAGAPLVPAPAFPAGGDVPQAAPAQQVPEQSAPAQPAPVQPAPDGAATVDPSALYDAALAHIKGDRLIEARQLLLEAIQVQPDNASARQRLLEVEATIQARIEQHLAAGQQQVTYLRFREAILEWEQVLALTRPEDERHQQAQDAIERARVRLGGR